jgi:cytochrome c biogenesis protein CcmG, thiol:disulfide interchange protein DsbE
MMKMLPTNRSLRHGLATLAGAACLLLAAAAHAVDVGQTVPDVELPGSTVGAKLSDLKGKLVYVDFWASWCGPCKQSFPWMSEMQRKYGARGLQIVAINVDAKRSDADAFLASGAPANSPTFALAFDGKGESAKKLGVKAMPTSVLVGPDGKVLFVHQGFRAEDRAELEGRLVAALGGK